MDVAEARDFLDQNHRCVLATRKKNGDVQLSPVLAVPDADGYAVISSRETAYKVKNLRRDPRAYLCVLTERFFGGWAFIEGGAEIVSLPEAMGGLIDYYRRAAGEHDDWDDYRAAMEKQKRVLIRIPIERAGPTVSG
jgi:PPOX class probable F420-dependent enzyme